MIGSFRRRARIFGLDVIKSSAARLRGFDHVAKISGDDRLFTDAEFIFVDHLFYEYTKSFIGERL
jgi:hypothetical protein